MASTLKSGSISLFTFSYNLQSVPVGIIGISYSVAAFPLLVKTFSSKDNSNFIKHIISAARQIIFWSLPIMVLLIILRAQIVRVILGTNSFSWADTRLTAASVALFVISLVSQGLVLLFVRGYYASGNTKKPLIVNVFSSIIVIVFAYTFIHIFRYFPSVLSYLESVLRVDNVPGTIMLALPLAYAFGSLVNFFLLWIIFKKDFFPKTSSHLFKTFFQSLVGSLTLGLVTYFSLNIFDDIFLTNTGLGIFLQGFFSGLIGIIFGIFVLSMLKNKELIDLTNTFKHKFWGNRVIAPEQGEL
jgi:putative peptidoglycan lipid II flippase